MSLYVLLGLGLALSVVCYSNQSTIRGPPGRPGKRGAIGLRGAPGPVGPQGPASLMNWTKIDNRMREIIYKERICTGIVYKGHCYWLPWIVASNVGNGGKSAAVNVCSSYGATLVDIETSEMYDVLYKYIQKAWMMYVDQPTHNYVDVWLASTNENGNVRSSTGGNIYTRWYRNHPMSHSSIAWIVSTGPTRVAPGIGMWTSDESYSRPVPFCRL